MKLKLCISLALSDISCLVFSAAHLMPCCENTIFTSLTGMWVIVPSEERCLHVFDLIWMLTYRQILMLTWPADPERWLPPLACQISYKFTALIIICIPEKQRKTASVYVRIVSGDFSWMKASTGGFWLCCCLEPKQLGFSVLLTL